MFKKIALSATIGIMLSSIIFTVITIVPWSQLATTTQSPQSDGAPLSPITITLHVSPFTEPQGPGSEANLTIETVSIWDASNVTVEINLPQGISLVVGNSTWNGDLKANVSSSFDVRIKATMVGNWTISATARRYFPPEGSWYGDIDRLSIHVSEDKIVVTPVSPMGEWETKPDLPPGHNEMKEQH